MSSESEVLSRLNAVEKLLSTTQYQIGELNKAVNIRTRLSDLKNSEDNLMTHINSLKSLTTALEQKLTLIKLPEETKYFLEQAEVENFRSNFNALTAMMASFDTLYSSLVSYVSNRG